MVVANAARSVAAAHQKVNNLKKRLADKTDGPFFVTHLHLHLTSVRGDVEVLLHCFFIFYKMISELALSSAVGTVG